MATVDGQALLALVSGGALVALGALLLVRRHRASTPPQALLGAFAVLWGVQTIAARAVFLVEDPFAGALRMVSHVASIPLYALLAQFAATYPRPLPVASRPAWRLALLGPGVVLAVLTAVDPAAMQARGAGTFWGWASLLLAFLPLVAALGFVVVRFARAFLAEAAEPARSQLRLATAAFLLYMGYASVYLLIPSGRAVGTLGPLAGGLYVGVLGGAVLATAAAVAMLARRDPAHRGAWVAIAGVPAATALALGEVDVVGLWRLGLVALLAYGLAKYQWLDVELRLHRVLRPVVVAVAALVAWGALGAVAFRLGQVALPRDALAFLALGLPAVASAAVLGPRLIVLLDQRFPYIRASEEYVLRRKLEVFRAATGAGLPRERRDALAAELRLKPWERRVLEAPLEEPGAPPGGVLAGRYRVQRFLGPGMYGRVLLARDLRMGEDVVLKEYAGFGGPAAAEAFAREAKTLGALDHPNVLAVRDVFRAGEDMYIALEHAPDGTLEDRLARGPLEEDEALDLAAQVLGGLAAAHRRGVVHRDVKPANLLFKRGALKLADFGVAFDPVLDGALRAARAQPGTLAWMAPEQARGEGASAASDVHAAGALLYRMLAGRHYLDLERRGEQAVRRAIASRAPRLPLPGVGAATNAVLARALAKDPAARYPDAGAMLREVRPRARPRLRTRPGPADARRAYGHA